MEAATLESLKFSIGRILGMLKSAGVMLKLTADSSKFFAGNLGVELSQQAHKTAFDFKRRVLTFR